LDELIKDLKNVFNSIAGLPFLMDGDIYQS